MNKAILFISVFVVAVIALPTDKISREALLDSPAVNEDLINLVNSAKTTWVAGHNRRFDGMTLREARSLLGAKLGGKLPPVKTVKQMDPPASFDSRVTWDYCPSVYLVRDQSACGSCWAFASTESFNDRYCIATNNTVIFSVTDVLACCNDRCGDGCNGGYPQIAWQYFTDTGAVTDTCYPYPFPACAHHVNTTKYPACPADEFKTPFCNKTCADGTDFNQDKILALSSYNIRGVNDAMIEISTKGPISAAFTVYSDFMTYTGGIYQHLSGDELGGHAVEIVGYGSENAVDYWIIKNSWNPTWGEQGYFRMIRGINDCGIENELVAGDITASV